MHHAALYKAAEKHWKEKKRQIKMIGMKLSCEEALLDIYIALYAGSCVT